LNAALAKHDLGRLVSAWPAPGGLFGQNVMLTTTSGRWVLRGHPHYDGQLERERFFSRLVHEHTRAEAPWPFIIDRSSDIFGWHFALMPMLPGEHLSDVDFRRGLPDCDRIAVAGAMGTYLALLQSGTWQRPADYDYAADDLRFYGDTYGAWFIAKTYDWLRLCRDWSHTTTTDDDVAWIDDIADRARGPLDEPFDAVLVHSDYSEGNVVVQRDADEWTISGIVDLGDAWIGDGEYDLARICCNYGPPTSADLAPRLRAFLDPYMQARPPRPGFHERMALYMVHDRLIFWEYGHRTNVWFNPNDHPNFRTFAQPFVDFAMSL
jgi:aminoglycoside phosphotransferase (APT) family kinase protein